MINSVDDITSSVLSLFEEQAVHAANKVALVHGQVQITFEQLNKRINQLAQHLVQQGVQAETLVPVCVHPGIDMIVGIYAILKAGGAYVPVDPTYPAERINFIVEDTRATIVLTTNSTKHLFEGINGLTTIATDDEAVYLHYPDTNLTIYIHPRQLAYIIYTSGSTGKPKGVMIEHGNLLNYLINKETAYINKHVTGTGGFMHMSFTFDASVTTLFMPLLSGKTLVISNKKSFDVFDDANFVRYAPYDFIKITPAHLQLLKNYIIEDGITVTKTLVIGGEALTYAHVEFLVNEGLDIEVINEYGPTETTVGCSVYRFNTSKVDETFKLRPISIGKPIDEVEMFILNKRNELLPAGIPGEIGISGKGVARGYLNREDITSENFITALVGPDKQLRIYKTGDFGMLSPDGNLEYLGRKDDQVKIRGYRVELGEVENVILQHEFVEQVIVLAKNDTSGFSQLVGYVVGKNGFSKQLLFEYLNEKVPAYMVPGTIIELDELPLTSHGKIDKKALLLIEDRRAILPENDEVATPLEEELRSIWLHLLELDEVGLHEDFFNIGGHSILAIRLVSAIRKQLKIDIAINDVFDHSTIAKLAAYINAFTNEGPVYPGITAIHPRPELIPLSFSQERLWFIDRLEGSLQYHVPAVLQLRGKLNIPALEKALRQVLERHEVLRTVIKEVDGKAYQVIKPSAKWNLKQTTWDSATGKSIDERIQMLILHPFNLSSDFMLRADLIMVAEEDFVLVVTVHHIASDGWSRSILVKEVAALYKSFDEEIDADLAPLPVQYADYSIWQREYLQGEQYDKKIAYWKNKLADVEPLQIPADRKRPDVWSTAGSSAFSKVSIDVLDKLKNIGSLQGCTLFMTLLAAFKVMLHRYSNQDDICVGTPIAGRPQYELENLMGFFINSLALRTTINGEDPFVDILTNVRTTVLEAFENQQIPFEKVVDEVVKERAANRNPIFQVMFVMLNMPEIPILKLGDVVLSGKNFAHTTTLFDFQFFVSETTDGLSIYVEYSTDLYERQTIERMLGHYNELLKSVANSPSKKIDKLEILTAEEQKQLLVDFNDTAVNFNAPGNLVSLFEKQVALTPNAVAIVAEGSTLTYAQLNYRSNQLAAYLIAKGIGTNDIIALCLYRGLEMPVAIWGVLKAGAAYLPIDPEYPVERIEYMLNDSSAPFVITTTSALANLVEVGTATIIDFDKSREDIQQYASSNPGVNIQPENLAYVIYTSGSTGRPKGTMNMHQGIVNRLLWAQQYFQLTANDSVLQKTAYTFDVSVWELIWPLIEGVKLVMAKPGGQKDNDYLKNIIEDQRITMVHFVPSMLAVFLPDVNKGECSSLQKVLCSGEALKPSHVQMFANVFPTVELHNLYGPTETAIDVTCYSVPANTKLDVVPIGKPVANTSIYILDGHNKPVPVGVAGQLNIAGIQVGKGYLNLNDLTASKFINDPYKNDGSKMYQTGDLARWRPEGNIEYLGRMDDQVKIRGFRIELGEIESVLVKSGIVNDAVVLAKQDINGNNRLVGYYTPVREAVRLKEEELYINRVQSWEELYDNEYENIADDTNVEFNLVGWNDSFSGEPIPAAHMQEWLNDIVSVIVAPGTKNVLEIGTGTGLIYFQLAGKVQKYIGTDFSATAINQIKNHTAGQTERLGTTELYACPAHQISIDKNEQIDTIVINSVAQYFPGEAYMNGVIENSLSILNGSGRIVIGDVRDNRLLELFKYRLQIPKFQATASIKDLKWAVNAEVLKENELCFSPEYFYRLKATYPSISHVEIKWKNATYVNELSAYRFTVILHVGAHQTVQQANWTIWNEAAESALITEIQEGTVPFLAIKDVPNSRLIIEKNISQKLAANNIKNVGDLLGPHTEASLAGMERLIQAALDNGYQYQLMLDEDPFSVNILCYRTSIPPLVDEVYYTGQVNTSQSLTNIPLYIEIGSELNKDLRSKLHQSLPEYFIPSELHCLEHLPLTANGKTDRKFLSLQEDRLMARDTFYAEPVNEVDKVLATIWQELLGLERVGIHDNFFELGGDSITTIQVVSRLRRLGYQLQPRDLFINQTIARLSEIINSRKENVTHGEQGILHGESGLLPIQQWFLQTDPVDVSYFNQAVLLSISKSVTTEMLQVVYGHLLRQHDALRFIYNRINGTWHQQYGNLYGNVITEVLNDAGTSVTIAAQIKEKTGYYQASLDIFKGDIIRFVHFIAPGAQEHNRLFMVIHHLAVDGVSWRILMEDLELMLSSIITDQPVIQDAKSSSYRQWYQALEHYGQQPSVLTQLTYWQKIVRAFIPLKAVHDLPVSTLNNNTLYHGTRLSEQVTQRLIQDVPKVYHTEINDLLLAALAIVLTRYMSTTQVVIALEGHGREDISDMMDTSRTVGWFTSLYPVALKVPGDKDYDAIIKSVKEQLRRVPQKGLGYGVLKYINNQQELQGNEPWEIMFNYLGQLDNVIGKSKWFGPATESTGSSRSALQAVHEKLLVNSSIQGGQLTVNWAFNSSYFSPQIIDQLAQQYLQTIEELVDHCQLQMKTGGQVLTPSDFGLGAEISYSELDRFLAEPYNHGTRKEHTESIYRLSGLQQGMLFHGLYEEGAIAYIDQFSCDLVNVNIPALSATWKMILDRHTSLRSSFHYDAFSIPVQCVYHNVDLPLDIMDLRNLTEEEQYIQVARFAHQDRLKGFDFKVAPLMRISLLQLADNRYRMVWTYNHILFDGWSMPVLMEAFLTTYQQLSLNLQLPLTRVDKFEDYIRFIAQQDVAQEQAYWKELVNQVTENTILPFINNKTGMSKAGEVYKKITLTLNEKITASIQQYAQQNHLTVNSIMQGVWAYLLHHYTNSQTVTYGVIVSGRPDELQDIEKRVGMYINTLPLISTINKGEKIAGWLQQLQHSQVASRQYQYTPLAQVQQWAGIMGDWFDTLLVFENYPINKLIKSERWNLDIENVQVDYQTNYPFNIIIASADQINIGFSFNTHLISTHDAQKIRDHFEHVLLQMVSAKENTEDIQVITPTEEYRILYEYNNTHVSYPHEKNLVSFFEQNVSIHANSAALIFDGVEVAYADLNSRSNQLAHYLHQAGVQAGMMVPVCIQRGVDMIVAILGILKCGAAYVPIDVAYPEERISYILSDTGCTKLLTDHLSLPKIPVSNQIEVLNLDELKTEIGERSIENLSVHIAPTQLAYIIYTSGSTGTPKGVMIEHSGVVNLALSQADSLQLRPGLRSLQFASFGFDASCYEIFNTLLSGGTLVIPKKEDLSSTDAFGQMLNENNVQLAVLPPSFQQEIKENTGNLKTIVSAGEPLNATNARYFQSKHIRLINAYGPTENTVCTTMTDKPINEEGIVTIGRPVANVNVFIVDRLGNLCAEGVNGELCIGGDQLARGYLNREDLTSEKFLERSFLGNSRLYRSGDTCRWLPGGNIEYVGRIDDQVKIRGFRIEPGEIENTLVNSPLVKEAIVLAKGDGHHNIKLVAFVVTNNGFSKEAITAYLGQILPAYMVPTIFVSLDRMPVNSSGKIDKKALSNIKLEESEHNNYVAPVTELEIKLTAIWQELLGIEKIGMEDNFFELGGNSLLAMRMTAYIERNIGLTIPIQVLFQARCISDLSKYFEIQGNSNDSEKNTETFELLDV